MLVPDPQAHPEAYVPPGAGERSGASAWPGTDRAAVIARARRQRLEERGLAVDDATLQRVADTVMAPGYELPGLYFTPEEVVDVVPEDVIHRVDSYLAEHPEVNGSTRMGWDSGRRVYVVGLVGDDGRHQAALRDLGGDRVSFEARMHTQAELGELADRVAADDEELEAAGYRVLGSGAEPDAGIVSVAVVGGQSGDQVRALFRERYGSLVEVEWLGASDMAEVPHAFASWTADGRRLRLFFSLERNGEEFGAARVVLEDADRVEVALTRLEPVGMRTLIGGYSTHHVDVHAAAPIGRRAVIDAATGAPRPRAEQLVHG